MPGPIQSARPAPPSPYTRAVESTAWRREMLDQMLARVREAQPAVASARAAKPAGPPPKGSLLDVYI
jgi:hypothetical protein